MARHIPFAVHADSDSTQIDQTSQKPLTDHGLQETSTANQPLPDFPTELMDFGKGFVRGGIQDPINGITQVIDGASPFHIQPLDLSGPDDHSPGSKLGSAVGKFVDFVALNAAMNHAYSAIGMVGSGVGASALKMGLTGAAYGGLLQPTNSADGNVLLAHSKNAAIGFGTFATLAAASTALAGSPFVNAVGARSVWGDMAMGAFSGFPAGVVNATLSATLLQGRLPQKQELLNTAGSYAAFGAALGVVSHFADWAAVARSAANDTRPDTVSDGSATVTVLKRGMNGDPVQVRIQENEGTGMLSHVPPSDKVMTKLGNGDWVGKNLLNPENSLGVGASSVTQAADGTVNVSLADDGPYTRDGYTYQLEDHPSFYSSDSHGNGSFLGTQTFRNDGNNVYSEFDYIKGGIQRTTTTWNNETGQVTSAQFEPSSGTDLQPATVKIDYAPKGNGVNSLQATVGDHSFQLFQAGQQGYNGQIDGRSFYWNGSLQQDYVPGSILTGVRAQTGKLSTLFDPGSLKPDAVLKLMNLLSSTTKPN